MKPRRSPLAILLGLDCLAGCDQVNSPTPQVRDKQARFSGTYLLEGDRLIFHSPPATALSCDGNTLVTQVYPGRSDTTTVKFSGNQLTVMQKPEIFTDSNGGEAVIQRYTVNSRVTGKSGIQGIWKESVRSYSVVSGTPSPTLKEYLDFRMLLAQEAFSYIGYLLEITDDTVWNWMEGDFSGYFLAEWNGDLPSQGVDTSSSERFDIRVRVVDPRNVELQGLKTGEAVTVTYAGPLDNPTYSSDRPGRIAYRSNDFLCPFDGEWNWFEQFLDMNRK